MMQGSPEIDFVVDLARRAGALLRERWGGQRELTLKRRADLVTDADLASEQLLVPALRERFPEHAVVAEEGGGTKAGWTWLVDPLDGTTNYAHGYPVFCVTLALLQQGEPVLGVTFDPLRDECFVAAQGAGAWLNGARLQVSNTPQLDQALLSTGYPYTRWVDPHNNIAEFSRMIMRVHGIVRSGAAAIDFAYVAAGRSDGHWELGLQPWDSAAGVLMVREAGGTVTNWHGTKYDPWNNQVVATNGHIHPELLSVLRTE